MPTPKAANLDRAPFSPEELEGKIEQATVLYQELLRHDMRYGGEPVIGKQVDEVEAQIAELKAALEGIGDVDRLANGLPLIHPSERVEQTGTSFPEAADSGYAHTLDYTHKVIPFSERIAVGQQQELSPAQQRAAANVNRAPQRAAA